MHSRNSVPNRNGQMQCVNNSGLPASKRPRVVTSSFSHSTFGVNDSGINTTSQNNDPFEDCFTGAELLELDWVASQAESGNKSNASGDPFKFVAPSIPQPTKSVNSRSEDLQHIVTKLQKQCSDYEQEIKKIRNNSNQKSGEVRLLRDKVNDIEKLLSGERQAKLVLEKAKKDEKSLREKDMEKKVENYKDQVEFKKVELQEAQNLIRNLELKNQNLLQDSAPSGVRDATTSQHDRGESSSPKKIRLVKPESPRVSNRTKKFKGEIIKSQTKIISVEENKPPVSIFNKKKACILQSNFAKRGTSDLPHMDAARLLQSLCSSTASKRDDKYIVDGCDALRKIMGYRYSHDDNEHKLIQACHIARMIKVILNEANYSRNGMRSDVVLMTSSLTLLHWLSETLKGFSSHFLTEEPDILSDLIALLSLNDCDVTKAAFLVLYRLSRDCSSHETTTALSTVTVVTSSYFSYDLSSKLLALDVLSCFIDDCDVVKALVTSQSDEEETFLQLLCKSCIESDAISNKKSYLDKVIGFLAVLVACHDVILSEHGCFVDIYCALNHLLFDMLNDAVQNSMSSSLINKVICVLRSCTNVHPDGIPGVRRDHKHLLLLWKLRKFVVTQGDSFWNQELIRVLGHEISTLEK